MKRVLVVDDEPGMVGLLGRVISRMHCDVITARSGTEALAVIGSDHLDLLVTDYRMPGMNGRELITALLAERPALKTLVVTGFVGDGEDPSWWAEQPVLEKPVVPKSLQNAIVGLIGPL